MLLSIERESIKDFHVINAVICSIKEREEGLKQVIATIRPQVDYLYCVLNGYTEAPEWIKSAGVDYRVDPENKLCDMARWTNLEAMSGYVFGLDDDIIYPDDYVQSTINSMAKYGNNGLFTYHGNIFKLPFKSYLKDRICYRFAEGLDNDIVVDLAGSGVCCFHTELFMPNLDFSDNSVGSDICLSLEAKKQGINRICLAKKSRWIKTNPKRYSGLYEKIKDGNDIDTAYTTKSKLLLNTIGVVVFTHNLMVRGCERVDNFLKSLKDVNIYVVSASNDKSLDIIDEYCKKYGAKHIKQVLNQDELWSKSWSINVGLKIACAENDYVMVADIDNYYPENFIDVLRSRLSPNAINLCKVWMSPEGKAITKTAEQIKQDCKLLDSRWADGACQCMSSGNWQIHGGYNEDMLMIGGMDNEAHCRANAMGLVDDNLDDETFIIHQWHNAFKSEGNVEFRTIGKRIQQKNRDILNDVIRKLSIAGWKVDKSYRIETSRKPNKMKAIILANGQATRFNGQCKQVLPVNGEPVIMRTVRQLNENGINDVLIVTVWDEIKALYDNCLDVGHTKGVVKTIEGCRDRWVETNDTILFLLGDVVWTDEAIKIAIETNKNVAFFGSDVEIFAVRVTPAGKSDFINGIRLCNFYKEFTTWVLYRLMAGFRTQQHKFETEMFVKITDKTDDIDYPSKYESRIANGYYGDFGTAPVTEIIVADGNVDPFPIAEDRPEVNENIPETVVEDKKDEEMPKIIKKRGRKPKNLL